MKNLKITLDSEPVTPGALIIALVVTALAAGVGYMLGGTGEAWIYGSFAFVYSCLNNVTLRFQGYRKIK